MQRIGWWIGIFIASKFNTTPAIPIRWLLCAVALMPVAVPATAAIYAVGTEPGCTHTTIQAAINAANSNFGPDFIRIPHSQIWNNQALVINTSQDLSLEGFWSDCNTLDTSGTRTTLDGAGGSSASVLRITGAAGTTVNLDSLLIRNGDANALDGEGGGIRYQGSGVLDLRNMGIINNTASKGGGVYATGNVDDARLVIGSNVTISGNTASRDGGGVFVNGMQLEMLEPNSIIAFNEALGDGGSKGYGGGVVVRSTGGRDATALIGSGGVGNLGAIYGNEAKWGGGVAVSAGADTITEPAQLRLFTTNAEQPAAIRSNFASEGGGAIYLWPNKNAAPVVSRANADAFLRWAELTDNAAPDGAAVYIDNSTDNLGSTAGGELHLNGSFNPPMPGSLGCPVGTICTRISGNIAERADGTDTDGALIFVDDEATLDVRRTVIEENGAGRIVDTDGDTAAAIENSLISGNLIRQELLRVFGALEITDSTIVDNPIGANVIISTGGGENVSLSRSIIWQPGKRTFLALAGGLPTVASVIASEVASLNAGFNAFVADPRFIDPLRGDYRLRAASRAIDLALPIAGDDRDAFGLPRDQRIGIVPRPAGRVRDVGAFERQELLPIVLNGDFDGDLNHWFLLPGHAGNYQTINAPGSTGGSAQVADLAPSGAPRLLGHVQCIHIPGPGTYALNGSARTGGNTPSEFNRTALIWEVRSDGGEGCIDGPILVGGEHTLSTTDAWNRPAQPAAITVSEVAWTANTSLTLILVVYPNAVGTFNGVFDRITLEVGTPPPTDFMFRDGFESP